MFKHIQEDAKKRLYIPLDMAEMDKALASKAKIGRVLYYNGIVNLGYLQLIKATIEEAGGSWLMSWNDPSQAIIYRNEVGVFLFLMPCRKE